MITVDVNSDPNFLKSDRKDPRDDSLMIFNMNEDNAIITEYFNQLCGISEAIDSVTALEDIQGKLQNNPNPDAGTLRIAQITVEHLCSSLPIENKTASMENFASSKQAALESIGSWIAAFFKAIYNAISAILDFIFGWMKPTQRKTRSDNTKATVKDIKSKKGREVKANIESITNNVFSTILPFKEVANDRNLLNTVEVATNSVGYVSNTVKIFHGVLEEFTKLMVAFASDDREDVQKHYSEAAIEKNEEWNGFIQKLGPNRMNFEFHKKQLEELEKRRNLPGISLLDNFLMYGGFMNGNAMFAYLFPSTKGNYRVTHFETMGPDPDTKVATGKYEFDSLQSLSYLADTAVIFEDTATELAGRLADLTAPLKNFQQALQKVQKRYEEDSDFKMGPMLHIGKTLVQQAGNFQQFMTLTDHTGLQYEKMLTLVSKCYKTNTK